MSTISVSLPSDGSTASVSQYNTPITTIVNVINGGLDNTNLASGAAIDASKLSGGISGMFGAWAVWTPSWTNLTVGNGVLTAKYVQIGKTVYYTLKLVWGTTTSISGAPQASLPVTAAADYSFNHKLGICVNKDTSAGLLYTGFALWTSSTTVGMYHVLTNSTYASYEASSSAAPFTWATTDIISIDGEYEAA